MSQCGRRPLADVCLTITDGSHYSPATSAEGFPYITVRDLKDGVIDFVECKRVAASDYADLKRNGCSPRHGDVLFSKDGTVGKVALVDTDEEFVVLSSLAILRPDPSKINSRFLTYILQTPQFLAEAIGLKTGVAIRRVILKNLKSISVPLPPLEEQRRIVAVLDGALAAIATAAANAEKNLANARELFENGLGAAFAELASSAPQRSIGEIAEIKGGKRVPKGYKLLGEPTPYPYLTVGDFTEDGTIDPGGVRYVSEAIHNQIKRYIVRSEDLYVSIAGTIGRTGIVPPEFDGAQLTENACRLVFKHGVSNAFVYFFTKSAAFRVQAIEQTRTAAQPKLALSRLEQIRLPVPDLSTQKALVEQFSELRDAADQVKEHAMKKLELLAALKQSLLHRAFSGELTEREPLAA